MAWTKSHFGSRWLAHTLAAIALAAALGCGGGGGGVTQVPMMTTPPPMMTMPPMMTTPPGPPPTFVPRTPPTAAVLNTPDDAGYTGRRDGFANAPEYAPSFSIAGVSDTYTALRRINAAAAYARGATGDGETILIQDSGVRHTHREFADDGFIGADKINFETESGYFPTDDDRDHGTMVAAVAAGNRGAHAGGNPLNMHGVAFDANVYFREIDLSVPGTGGYDPFALSPDPAADRMLADLVGALIGQPGAVINFSFGVEGGIERYDPAEVRRALPTLARRLEQPGVAAADKQIIVWAAGNAFGQRIGPDMLRPPGDPDPRELAMADSPELFPGLGVYFEELRPHVLAVVALDQSGGIADYSNRCGVARDFCIAAPGSALSAAGGADDEYAADRGTSFAAPLVSGSLAVLREYFRGQLGNTELVNRLLGTANRRGIYADSDIYGHGLVDLDAATRPSGATTMVIGNTLDGPGVAEALTELASGAAFGDALARGLAEREVAVFDELDAPFFRTLDAYLDAPTKPRAGIEDRLARMGDDPRGAPAPIQPGNPITLRLRLASASRHSAFAGMTEREQDTTRNLELAALSLTTPLGRSGDAFLSLRHHPGWNFGLHGGGVIEPGTFSDDDAFASPYLSFARDGESAGFALPLSTGALRVAAFRGGAQWGERRDYDPSPAHGALFEYRLPQRNRAGLLPSGFAIQSGWLQETGRLMGSRPQGAFGDLRSETGFLGATAHKSLSARWTAFAALHLGVSRPQISGDGLLRRVSPLWSSAFGVGISGRGLWLARDRLSLRLSQPLRVEAGHADLRWVSGRTRYRQVQLETATLNLTPSARQLDFELAYALPLTQRERQRTDAGAFNLAALATLHPDHSRTTRPEFSLLFRYHREF